MQEMVYVAGAGPAAPELSSEHALSRTSPRKMAILTGIAAPALWKGPRIVM
jgi:hypothetical protein